MVVFSKKRILFLCMMICVGMFSGLSINEQFESIETVALPVSDRVIILDAGHR